MEQPAIFGIMNRVGLWFAWLVVSSGTYSALVGFRWTLNLYFLAMMLIVGYMVTKKEWTVPVLTTASFVMITVTLMLVL
jgi:hypothetical protein